MLDSTVISLCLKVFDWAKYNWSLSNLIAFLRMNLFVKIFLNEWLDNPFRPKSDYSEEFLQGSLFT